MSATPGECVRIDRSQWSNQPRPVEKIPLRGRLIVIGFVAAAPIVVAAWLVLLGWAALALL